jgi:hypothetical protein
MESSGPYCCMNDRFFALHTVHIVCKYKNNLWVTAHSLFCSFFSFRKSNRKTIMHRVLAYLHAVLCVWYGHHSYYCAGEQDAKLLSTLVRN